MRLKNKLLYLFLVTTWANHANANYWPVGVNDTSPTLMNLPISISVLDNDYGDNLIISSVNETSVAWGKVTISTDQKSLNYTPYKGFSGEDEFWYELKDDQGRTNAAKVQVSVAENAGAYPDWPVGVTDSVEAIYDTVSKFKVLDNDIGSNLKLVEVNEWSTNKGKAWISADNEISYQQYGEERGERTDEFWYVFADQWGRRNAAKVSVSLIEQPATAWPTAAQDSAETSDDQRIVIRVLENDTGSGLTLKESNLWTQSGGKTQIVGTYIQYTPPSGFSGTDRFWYVLADDQGRTNSAEVTVQVTASSVNSVVEFCGNTYQTDGTKAGTQLTSLSPATPISYPSTAIPPTGNSSELGVINGRRYFVETTGSQQNLKMDIDGVISSVSSVNTESETYAMGTYKGVLYFIEAGRYLLAHDGDKLTPLGDLLLDLGAGNFYISPSTPVPEDPYRYINTVSLEPGNGDAMYFSITNSITPSDGSELRERVTYLRISDDLDWRPMKVQETIPFDSENYTRGDSVRSLHFFNGLDYYVQTVTTSQFIPPSEYNSSEIFTIKQRDKSYLVTSINADADAIVEDRGRLFIITKAASAHLEDPNKSTLLVVDNQSNEFVELAVCE